MLNKLSRKNHNLKEEKKGSEILCDINRPGWQLLLTNFITDEEIIFNR